MLCAPRGGFGISGWFGNALPTRQAKLAATEKRVLRSGHGQKGPPAYRGGFALQPVCLCRHQDGLEALHHPNQGVEERLGRLSAALLSLTVVNQAHSAFMRNEEADVREARHPQRGGHRATLPGGDIASPADKVVVNERSHGLSTQHLAAKCGSVGMLRAVQVDQQESQVAARHGNRLVVRAGVEAGRSRAKGGQLLTHVARLRRPHRPWHEAFCRRPRAGAM